MYNVHVHVCVCVDDDEEDEDEGDDDSNEEGESEVTEAPSPALQRTQSDMTYVKSKMAAMSTAGSTTAPPPDPSDESGTTVHSQVRTGHCLF